MKILLRTFKAQVFEIEVELKESVMKNYEL